ARRPGLVSQMGNQGSSENGLRRAIEVVQAGVIGAVKEVHVWTNRPIWPQGLPRPQGSDPVPEGVNWDVWIGPAAMRPFKAGVYHPFNWRGWLDFGTGALGDIGCHSFDSVFRALKLKYPTHIQAVSTLVNDETYPLGSMVTYDFPVRGEMSPLRLRWYDGGMRPPRIQGMDSSVEMGAGGVLYMGAKGQILGDRILPDSLNDSYKKPDPYLPSSPGHRQEWILACKGGEPAGSNY